MVFCHYKGVSSGRPCLVVWSWKSSSGTEHLLAVRRRIFMGLEEGFCKTADKGGSKIRIGGLGEQCLQEGEGRDFHRGKCPEPFFLLHQEEFQKTVQLGKGDGETPAEALYSREVQEILCQDTEDEEQAVAGIGDDEIREDGMGMAAGTDEAKDAEAVSDRGAIYEIHQGTVIIGMDLAAACCPTEGTGLQLGTESNHERLK